MANIRREFGDDLTLKNGNLGINTTTAQEKIDVVGVVKGQDLYTTGVSSLTAYEGFLRADNQIVESTTLEFGQGLKSSLSGEIIVGTGVTVTIGAVGLGTAEVGVGNTTGANGKTASNIDTTDINLAGGSQIECLKVYNTFTPPSGGTNERPYAPKPGELYYNYDFKTIEFFDGYGWRQVDNTTRSGRAVYSGGLTPSVTSTIDYYNIHTLGNAMNFGDATIVEGNKAGCSSAIRGLSGGSGDTSNDSTIDYVTIPSEGNAIDFGDLYNGRGTSASMSSSTRGLWAAGRSPTNQDTIDYVEIATIGNALDFGDTTVTRQWLTGCSSSTRGIIAGGENNPFFPSPGRTSRIEFITMASKGDAILFGDLTATTGNPGGCSNSTRGFFGGGEPQTFSKIDMITIASTGNAVEFGNLTVGRLAVNGAGSQTRGTFLGGWTNLNVIDYISMATSGNAQDFGDLTIGRWSGASFTDCHGGLGGF